MENTAKGEKRISIRFPLDVLDANRTLAKHHERSFNGEIIRALREYAERDQGHKGGKESWPRACGSPTRRSFGPLRLRSGNWRLFCGAAARSITWPWSSGSPPGNALTSRSRASSKRQN